MLPKLLLPSLAVSLAVIATPAFAREDDARITIGVTGGSLGIGPSLGYRINDVLGIRADATFLGVSHGFDSDDVRYDGDVRLRSGGVQADIYPFGGGFRLSGGVRINGNRVKATGKPNATTYTFNGVTYLVSDVGTVSTRTEIKEVAPTLTLGYGGGMGRGFAFGIDAGVMFQGRVRIQPIAYTGPLQSAALSANLEVERQSLQKDIDDYKLYPILQIGLGYRF